MKNLFKNIKLVVVMALSLAMLTGCWSSTSKTKGRVAKPAAPKTSGDTKGAPSATTPGSSGSTNGAQGGGDFGGGDVILYDVSVEEVVQLIHKAKELLPYAANAFEMIVISNGFSDDNSEDRVKLFERIRKFFYEDPNHNVYKLIENLEIDIKTDEACKNKEGESKDGSVYNVSKGAFCISAKTLAAKLKGNHAFGSILGLMLHELVHRSANSVLGTEVDVEMEAKLVESHALSIKGEYANMSWLDETIRSLLDSESSLVSSINGIDGMKYLLDATPKENEVEIAKIKSKTCYQLGKTSELVNSELDSLGSGHLDTGVTAIRFQYLGRIMASDIQMGLLDMFCTFGNLSEIVQDKPISLYEYLTHEKNNSQPKIVLAMAQDRSIKIFPLRDDNFADVKRALQETLKNIRVLLEQTGRTIDAPFEEQRILDKNISFEIVKDIILNRQTDDGFNTQEFVKGEPVGISSAAPLGCKMSHSQYFPRSLVTAGKSVVLPTSSGNLYLEDPDDGYGGSFYVANYKGRLISVVFHCRRFTDDSNEDVPTTPELIEEHFRGYLKRSQ